MTGYVKDVLPNFLHWHFKKLETKTFHDRLRHFSTLHIPLYKTASQFHNTIEQGNLYHLVPQEHRISK